MCIAYLKYQLYLCHVIKTNIMENTQQKLNELIEQLIDEADKLVGLQDQLNICIKIARSANKFLLNGKIDLYESEKNDLIEALKKYNEMALTNLFFGL